MNNSMTSQTFRLKQLYDEETLTSKLWSEVSKFYKDLDTTDFDLATHLLFYKYCNCEIAYDTEDSFYRNLVLTSIDLFPQYLYRLKWLKEIYSLSIDELRQGDVDIINNASAPNEKVDDPLNTYLDYLDGQTLQTTKQNKFDRLQDALSRNSTANTKRFLDGFANLFLKVYPSDYYSDFIYKED